MKILLIDDMRNIASTRIARTYDEGIQALREERWDLLYLDHDLGEEDDDNKNGYRVLCWIEENPQHAPGKITLVTSNASARKKMELAIDAIYSGRK